MSTVMKRAAICVLMGSVWVMPHAKVVAQGDGPVQAIAGEPVPAEEQHAADVDANGQAVLPEADMPSDGIRSLEFGQDGAADALRPESADNANAGDGAPAVSGDEALAAGEGNDESADGTEIRADGEAIEDAANAVPARPPVRIEDFIPVTEISTDIERAMLDRIQYLNPSVNIATIPSLFFSRWEHDLIIDARKGLNTRPADAVDDGVSSSSASQSSPTAVSGPRDISLSGIIYRSKDDWVIWLNNMRISPGRLPNQIMDLKVFKDYVELEWFDASTNQIFPVRLRAHQRFNIDARIFLPGGP